MSTLREFATFPLLAPHDRVRLASFVLRCQRTKDGDALDDVPLLDWLRKTCGKRTVARMWEPLLDSKFDGDYDDLPATYMWARTKRMSKTRDAAGRELMGWLSGGYQRLVDTLADRIRELGGTINAGIAVSAVAGSVHGVDGIAVDGVLQEFDHVLCTLLPPQASRLLPDDVSRSCPRPLPLSRRDLRDRPRRPQRQPVLHAQHHRPAHPADHGGRDDTRRRPRVLRRPPRLRGEVRRPGASRPGAPEADVAEDYLGYVERMFPSLDAEAARRSACNAPGMVEPVHTIGGRKRIPDCIRWPASRSRRPRTSTPRSSTARP